MFGATTSQASDSSAGVELEAVSWHGWLGFAVEASARTPVDSGGSRPVALGGSIRVRLMQALVPSLLEPSDVELGVQLQGIVERTLWNGELTGHEPYEQGIGLALRLRGSTDEDMPRLITESRFFIRVMSWQAQDAELARAMQPIAPADREVMVLIGIGAAFGRRRHAVLAAVHIPLIVPRAPGRLQFGVSLIELLGVTVPAVSNSYCTPYAPAWSSTPTVTPTRRLLAWDW